MLLHTRLVGILDGYGLDQQLVRLSERLSVNCVNQKRYDISIFIAG